MALQNFSQSGTIVQNPQTSIENGFMLFGVRVMTDGSFRKCVSLNNLAQYQQSDPSQPGEGEAVAAAGGYRSDDEIHAASAGTRERKRGVPWTEEEHKLFLFGLERVGKGDWRGISRNFVKTRTPTQVASHAQKYFLRRSNLNRRRRRSSLFDITTDTFLGDWLLCSPGEEPSIQNHQNQSQVMPSLDLSMDCLPVSSPTPMIVDDSEKATIQPNESMEPKVVKPIPVFPSVPLGMVVGLGMPPSPLSAKLSEQHSARHSAFQAITSLRSCHLEGKVTVITVS